MEKKIKEPVKLRSKKIESGESLYLDIYFNGKRSYEFLNLYLTNGTSRADKQHNKDVMSMANTIKAQRLLDIQSGKFHLVNKEKQSISFVEYLHHLTEEYKEKGRKNYAHNMRNVELHVGRYAGDKVRLKDVDTKFVLGFIKYLNTTKGTYGAPLSELTIYSYYTMFAIALNRAVKYNLIMVNPCSQIPPEDKPHRTSRRKEYLTIEEVQQLINTECRDGRVKRFFLFLCFTGLRYGDGADLRWKSILKTDDGRYQVETIQQKTKEVVYVPLSDNAMKFLPERNKIFDGDDNRVFQLPERSWAYDILHEWAREAGIKKKVTFHVARHTYATLLLYYGADIYTVSKLLGHTSIQTTQIYARVVDAAKRKAVDMIPDIDV